MPQSSRQTIAPRPFTVSEISSNHWVTIGTKIEKEVVTLRYLTSKVVFTEETITLEEICALFLSFETVVMKMARHQEVQRKIGSEIFLFRALFQNLEHWLEVPPSERRMRLEAVYKDYRGKLFSRRYYYAVRGQVNRLFQIRLRTRFPQKFAPKAFIGKGYGDHGTAKNPAFDGSPSWQEVAMNRSEQEDTSSTSEITTWLFASLRVHQAQITY